MRVAIVHASFAVRGGAEAYIANLAEALAGRGHEVRIYSPDPAGLAVAGATVHRLRPRVTARLATGVPALRKLLVHLGDLADPTGLRARDLNGFAPDVVHVHNWQALGVLAVARAARAYPACHSVHDHAICDPNNTLATIGRLAVLDRALAVRSAWIARQLRRCVLLFAGERTRDTVVRHAPAVARTPSRLLPLATPVPWHRMSWPVGDRDTFLFVGALSPHKGLDLLLDAWRSRAATAPGTLLVAGDGPMRADVERVAAGTLSVRYLGYVDEPAKRAAMARAAWLVFPSQGAETYGLVCAEALMAGRPVIASAVAAPPMASPGSTFVFDDRAGLAALLDRAAAMPDGDYARMSASAAADGRRLDWDDHVDTIVHMYWSLRAPGGSPANPAEPGVPGRPVSRGDA